VSGVFQNIGPPPPLLLANVCPPPHQRGGVHTRRAVRGWGFIILEDARHWIGLLQYNLSTLSPQHPMSSQHGQKCLPGPLPFLLSTFNFLCVPPSLEGTVHAQQCLIYSMIVQNKLKFNKELFGLSHRIFRKKNRSLKNRNFLQCFGDFFYSVYRIFFIY
jgi:hypothetical protein